jgi:hypothetical protein
MAIPNHTSCNVCHVFIKDGHYERHINSSEHIGNVLFQFEIIGMIDSVIEEKGGKASSMNRKELKEIKIAEENLKK